MILAVYLTICFSLYIVILAVYLYLSVYHDPHCLSVPNCISCTLLYICASLCILYLVVYLYLTVCPVPHFISFSHCLSCSLLYICTLLYVLTVYLFLTVYRVPRCLSCSSLLIFFSLFIVFLNVYPVPHCTNFHFRAKRWWHSALNKHWRRVWKWNLDLRRPSWVQAMLAQKWWCDVARTQVLDFQVNCPFHWQLSENSHLIFHQMCHLIAISHYWTLSKMYFSLTAIWNNVIWLP